MLCFPFVYATLENPIHACLYTLIGEPMVHAKTRQQHMLEEPCAQSLSMQSEQVSLLHDLCECFFARGRGHTCPPHCEAKKDIASIADDNRQQRIFRSSGHVCHVLNRKSPRLYHSKKKESPIATVQQNDKPRRGMLV